MFDAIPQLGPHPVRRPEVEVHSRLSLNQAGSCPIGRVPPPFYIPVQTRNPMLLFLSPGSFLFRFAPRRFLVLLL